MRFYRIVGITFAIIGLLGSAPEVQAAEPWTAHPPIHVQPPIQPFTTARSGYTPAQIRHGYGFDNLPNTGNKQIIGIVDAYHSPNIASDLKTFSTTFHLPIMNGLPGQSACSAKAGPHPCFQVDYVSKPANNAGWEQEASLDVEWAHAIASGADIVLTEAKTANDTDLLQAVDLAVTDGASVISMSWGGPEFATQDTNDTHFKHSGVSFFAASGDSGTGASWPAASRYVVSVGGTKLSLDSNGNRTGSETAWNGSGGGISQFTAEPAYQSNLGISSHSKRAIPDVSFNADPTTGYQVYDSNPYQGQSGWLVIGGTSAASPQWAALTSLANQNRATSLGTNVTTRSPFYAVANANSYRDITSGTNGSCGMVCRASTGYDFVTGIGTPIANKLVPALSSY